VDRHDGRVIAPRLMLLDAASLYFRAFFGVPDTVKAGDGSSVNAVRGMLDFIARLVSDHRPTHLVACMDEDWRPQFRVDLIPSYKAHRVAFPGSVEEEVPDALSPQIPVIEAVLDALGIARLGVAGYEADDVIGTLAVGATMPVDVVTGDRDLFQLVDDERGVRILYTARGVGRIEVVDEAAVTRKYAIPGRAYADFAVLRGDPSDGLPGVPGVGEKTAASLITMFGSLDGLLSALDDPDRDFGGRRKVEAARDYLAAAPTVVAVAHDVPVPSGWDPVLPREPADPAELVRLADEWNLESPVNRVLNALTPTPSS
jgi:5'-3' exonuclease